MTNFNLFFRDASSVLLLYIIICHSVFRNIKILIILNFLFFDFSFFDNYYNYYYDIIIFHILLSNMTTTLFLLFKKFTTHYTDTFMPNPIYTFMPNLE